ncbi:unnamed protein product [Rotaria magnacalcarata]|uniref:Uncharacterized protein n=1 Tax=Rotaria magnacalcarata TaxID=392030 RepID=A0A814XAE4_9BILA|nr:unnamed protein product [Rotaria magnacalcarata]CAF1211483.1 unnamed protein product [Rotaria magnacalcarata]CAF1914109.1 unnamed protein product [Rotaria magnacalcarata]CAF1966604.1 unnamed protein product [Rotaria magnacalcarata]CAF2220423.1 unnamed protein product [Rotaria magnacalcarata]
MSITSRNKKAETLAWITDDEAEFWTSTSPVEKRDKSNQFSTIKDITPVILPPDGLHINNIDETNKEIENNLSLSYKELIEKQAKEISTQAEEKQVSQIFQSTERRSDISMSLVDQLSTELTEDTNNSNDDIFEEIDHNEKPAVANDNGSSDKLFDSIIKLTDNIPFINDIRSFIDEIGEETNVLLGFMDEESLVNRRSRRAKFSSSSIKDDNTL